MNKEKTAHFILQSLVKWTLYLTSLFPLYILLVVQHVQIPSTRTFRSVANSNMGFSTNQKILITTLTILIILTLIISIFVWIYSEIKVKKSEFKQVRDIERSDIERVDTMSYIGTYIMPMLTINTNDSRTLLTNVILILVLGFFYVMNSQIYINPLFNLMGLNVFRGRTNFYLTSLTIDQFRGIVERKEKVRSFQIFMNCYYLKRK